LRWVEVANRISMQIYFAQSWIPVGIGASLKAAVSPLVHAPTAPSQHQLGLSIKRAHTHTLAVRLRDAAGSRARVTFIVHNARCTFIPLAITTLLRNITLRAALKTVVCSPLSAALRLITDAII